jgi:hypothetical protein
LFALKTSIKNDLTHCCTLLVGVITSTSDDCSQAFVGHQRQPIAVRWILAEVRGAMATEPVIKNGWLCTKP